jgi:Putative peptidoglycan binding domain
MASRVISILATVATLLAMVAPALAQSSGGSTGTGSAPAMGSGGSTTSAPPAPSATQPGPTTTSPSTPAPGTGATGPSKPGMGTTSAPSRTSSAPSMGSTSKSDTMDGGAGSSEQVKAVQKALQDKGMDPGPIDGIMGPKTMAALKAFQKDQKLAESGRLYDQTREKLGVSP